MNLGTGPGPDTLYVADGSNGATAATRIVSRSLVGVERLDRNGLYLRPHHRRRHVPRRHQRQCALGAGRPAADVAVNASGQKVANIFVTGATTISNSNNTQLAGLTDSSGYKGTLTGTFTQLATAPTGDDFHGLAFAPNTPLPNNGDTPEVPLALLLPIAGGAIFGGVYLTHRRRRHAAPTVVAGNWTTTFRAHRCRNAGSGRRLPRGGRHPEMRTHRVVTFPVILAAAATLTPLVPATVAGAQQEPVYGQASAPIVDQITGGPWSLTEGSVNAVYPAAESVGRDVAPVFPLRERRGRNSGPSPQLLRRQRCCSRDGLHQRPTGGPSTYGALLLPICHRSS